MEDFVAAVKVFSQDKNWTELKVYINESASLIAKNASKIDSALSALNPAEQTLGYLGLILYKVSLPNCGDFELLFNQIQKLIEVGCKNQLQQGVDKFCYVCHFLTNCLIEQKKTFRGILLMSEAILKAQNHPSELISIHADLFQLCLASKCLKPAVKFLNIDVTDVNNEFDHFDAKTFLLYYYYGGMIYLALKEYHKALFFFQTTVTTPAMVVSHIMLEAYKKYLLVSLFLHGKILPLPKYTSAVVSRYIKPLSSPYVELSEAYSSIDQDQLRMVANKHQAVFQRDINVGLVKQVMSSLTKKRIQKLTKTFLTLSLVDMATRVKLSNAREAEEYLLQMKKQQLHKTV
ncbi:COP9 signalosome complex subunit 3-like isoform X2 [Hydractinia symbiolongicarpus]|uniref:COP9 signalosome complex subunit 3-like isoform X2 n=1 Tax=Hydractinia symbiolongicarpus TaxID=13093 RepID=UPI002550B4FE|nr:COP9 signalosome complex subunit 3-like isoform X2 [Hydractinia symbiolongicarpus]